MPAETCFDHAIGGESRSRPDLAVAELAGRQHGVVARRQLLALGMGKRGIEVRLARGRLHLVHRGVYAVGHRVLTTEGWWMAAVLACGPGAVLSHGTAAQLWGLLPRSEAMPEVTRPRKFKGRQGIRAHHARLAADEVDVVDGIPVTSVHRTIFDLAATSNRRQVERAMKEAEVRGLTDRLSIPDLIERHPGARGTATLRALFAEKSPPGRTRNEFE